MKLLIKFPTRGRPQRFLETLKLYSGMLSGNHSVKILVIIDTDDDTMNNMEMRTELDGIPNVIVQVGAHKDKIDAINDPQICDALEWDVLLLASDDMIPQMNGYDDVICSDMHTHFPRYDGVLWFNDGYTEDRLNTLCILGRKYYEGFGYIYHPDYKSLWCDNEFMDVTKINGRFVYIPTCIIKHEHWANNKSIEKDARYVKTEVSYKEDEATYKRRKGLNFDIKLLSILICALNKRRSFYNGLMENLNGQLNAGGYGRSVEILTESDNGMMTIGDKRNLLLDRSGGEYVAFIDDDDYVSKDYIEKIVAAVRGTAPDCVGINGQVFMGNFVYKPFVHSIRYKEQGEKPGFFYRPPNHLNPVKRSIAMAHRFPPLDRCEDTEYSMAMVRSGALKTEVMVEGVLYTYVPGWMREKGHVVGVEMPKEGKPAHW